MAPIKSRRHISLIPLSREHQYALLLCLRIHRGLPEHSGDQGWLRVKGDNAVRFFESELAVHFQAEEQILFPAMNEISESSPIIDELLADHRRIRQLVTTLAEVDVGLLATTLKEFADILEAHIRKEERVLFPIYEEQASPETRLRVGNEIFALMGSGANPRHPELLE